MLLHKTRHTRAGKQDTGGQQVHRDQQEKLISKLSKNTKNRKTDFKKNKINGNTRTHNTTIITTHTQSYITSQHNTTNTTHTQHNLTAGIFLNLQLQAACRTWAHVHISFDLVFALVVYATPPYLTNILGEQIFFFFCNKFDLYKFDFWAFHVDQIKDGVGLLLVITSFHGGPLSADDSLRLTQ